MPSCGVCPSVHLSITFVNSVETNKHMFKIFSQSDSHNHYSFFRTKHHGSIPTGTPPLTGASNAGGVGKSRGSQPISGSIACCSTAKCNTISATDDGKLITLVAGKRRSLLMAGDDNEVFMTRSLNVTPKTTEQHLIARSVKSEA